MNLKRLYFILHIAHQLNGRSPTQAVRRLISAYPQSEAAGLLAGRDDSLDDDLFALTAPQWNASLEILCADLRLSQKEGRAWENLARYLTAEKQQLIEAILTQLEWLQRHNGFFITLADSSYSNLLREIYDPPFVLFGCGHETLLQRSMISVVGSRKMTNEAATQSFALGYFLARSGFAVVSGGAIGCDIEAHRGVLASDLLPCPAVVVSAGGLGQLYPRCNAQVFEALLERGGVVLSERLWGAACVPRDFPMRNRIIAGLSRCTILVQAMERSGAALTARLAVEEGREVMVLKCAQDDARSYGGGKFISEGATVLEPYGFEAITNFYRQLS